MRRPIPAVAVAAGRMAWLCLGLLLLPVERAFAAAAGANAADDLQYSAVSGDTIYGIAHRLLADPSRWPELQRYNRVAQPRKLPPGQLIRIPVAWLKRETVSARIVATAGDVIGTRGGQSLALGPGAELAQGTSLVTGSSGFAVIRLADGTTVHVQPASELELLRLQQVLHTEAFDDSLRLSRGRVAIAAAPRRAPAARLEVVTPKAVAGVRGTEFRAGASEQRSQFEVLAGRVAVGDPARRDPELAVAEGEGVVFDPAAGGPEVVKLLPPPDLTAISAEQTRLPVDIGFPPLPGTTNYRTQLALDPAFERPLVDQTMKEPVFSGGALADGTYWLRVRAIDERGLEGRDAKTSFRVSARPQPPLSMVPRDYGETRETAVRFEWTRSADAIAYHFQLATDLAFESLVTDLPRVENTNVQVPLPLAVGDYYWRVAGVAAGGRQGPYSAVSLLERRPRMDAPEAPKVNDDSLFLRWTGDPSALYRVQVAKDPAFAVDVVDYETQGPQLTMAKPFPGEYYVRVQTVDAAGRAGAYSDPQRFDVPGTALPWALLLLLAIIVLF
jgi:hypothetical protein